MTDWIRKWALLLIAVVFVAVSVVLLLFAVNKGAQTKDVLLDVATGLLTGVIVTIIVAIAEDRRQAVVQGESLRLSLVSAPSLRGVDLSGKDLRGIELFHKNLNAANLAGANLAGATLFQCDLLAADLTKADLSGARIERSRLGGAKLQSTKFLRANARGALFYRAEVNQQTDFTRADLRTSRGLTGEPSIPSQTTSFSQLKRDASDGHFEALKAPRALYDRRTRWPDFQNGESSPGAEEDNSIADSIDPTD